MLSFKRIIFLTVSILSNLSIFNCFHNIRIISTRWTTPKLSSVEPLSESFDANLGSIGSSKRVLLNAIAARNKYRQTYNTLNDVLLAAERIENDFKSLCNSSCAEGKWSLIFSTSVQSSTVSRVRENSIVDILTGYLYKSFFQFAPFLAGSQDIDSKQDLYTVSNTQDVSIASGTVRNIVCLTPKGNSKTKIEIEVAGEVSVDPSRADCLDIVFTSFSLNGFRFPLPRPRGVLRTTFCDDTMRIGRGGKGGLFILKRL